MEVLNNYISKLFISDNTQSYIILAYIDIDTYTEKDIINYIQNVYNNNDILKKVIVNNDGSYYMKTINVDIKDYYDIQYISYDKFDITIKKLLNEPFSKELHWKFHILLDTETKRNRIYFKINHAYADGYQIIKILTSPYKSHDITTKFSRGCPNFIDKLYHWMIGSIVILISYAKYILNVFLQKDQINTAVSNSETDFIICKKLSLKDIQIFTKIKNITVNDFIYALIAKTDYFYHRLDRQITCITSINVSSTKNMNNMAPIFFTINNSYANNVLLDKTNAMFKSAKYSLFIPLYCYCIDFISEYLPFNLLSKMYNKITDNADYIYSNMIGPSKKSLIPEVRDLHFISTAKSSEIIFNIISYDDELNIICSFKKGVVTDKKYLEDCIYRAYSDLFKQSKASGIEK